MWRAVVCLLAVGSLAAGCDVSCIRTRISVALRRIASSNRTPLLPGVYFLRSANVSSIQVPNGARSVRDLVSQAEAVFASHSLHWNALPGVDLKVTGGPGKDFHMTVTKSEVDPDGVNFNVSGRTFGFRRRLKMVLLPIMYKLGVITTLLGMLTVFSLKGLTIGILLLALGFGGLFAKLKGHHHGHHWDGSDQKEVHLHVHPYKGGFVTHDPWQRVDMEPPYEFEYTAPYWKQSPDYYTRRYDAYRQAYEHRPQYQPSVPPYQPLPPIQPPASTYQPASSPYVSSASSYQSSAPVYQSSAPSYQSSQTYQPSYQAYQPTGRSASSSFPS